MSLRPHRRPDNRFHRPKRLQGRATVPIAPSRCRPTGDEVEAAISALQLPAEVPAQAREEILQRAIELFNENQGKAWCKRVTSASTLKKQ